MSGNHPSMTRMASGPAAGAGLSIALACDLRIGAASAFINTGYARIALSGDYGIAWLLTRLVGTSRARELMNGSTRRAASRSGCSTGWCPVTSCMRRPLPWHEASPNGPVTVLGLMKDNLDDALALAFEDALDREAVRLVESAMSEDHFEAVRAFADRKASPPTGR